MTTNGIRRPVGPSWTRTRLTRGESTEPRQHQLPWDYSGAAELRGISRRVWLDEETVAAVLGSGRIRAERGEWDWEFLSRMEEKEAKLLLKHTCFFVSIIPADTKSLNVIGNKTLPAFHLRKNKQRKESQLLSGFSLIIVSFFQPPARCSFWNVRIRCLICKLENSWTGKAAWRRHFGLQQRVEKFSQYVYVA